MIDMLNMLLSLTSFSYTCFSVTSFVINIFIAQIIIIYASNSWFASYVHSLQIAVTCMSMCEWDSVALNGSKFYGEELIDEKCHSCAVFFPLLCLREQLITRVLHPWIDFVLTSSCRHNYITDLGHS